MDTKALKQKILDLAISGKLVPQDPNDEPASVLLERIRAEKQQMVKDGKLKTKDLKNDTVIFVGDDNLHYEKFSDGTIKCIEKELKALKINIPKSWNWVRLGHVFMHNTGKTLNSANQSGELLEYITTSNLYWNRFELQTLKKMYFTANEIDKCTVKKGDLLVCEGGDIGRAAIWNYDYDIRIQNHIHKLRPYVFVCTEFFYYLFYSYKNASLIGGKGIGLQGLSSNALHSLLFPIPPVQEQLRITSAINSLFSNIDSINANGDELKTLVNITKSKILDLAIRGKLVPQNSDDEPASVLLERIRKEKEELIKTGKLKRDKRESVIFRGEDNSYYEIIGSKTVNINEELPYKIPLTWTWVRLETIGIWSAGATPNRAHSEYYGGDIPWLKTGDLNDGCITDIPETITELAIKETSVKLNPVGSILIAMYGATIGKLGILTKPATTNQACCACCPFEGVYNKYLFYFLMSHKSKFINRGIGGAQQNISKEKIVATLMPLPPINEQKAIVARIEKLSFMLNSMNADMV